MSQFTVEAIATVRNERKSPQDDQWDNVSSEIVLADHLPAEALTGLDTFSHVEVIFLFDQVPTEKIVTGARHPRNNEDWPLTGIFAQRGKNRPNRLGLCTAKVLAVQGRTLTVQGLDAIDGTPILDLKPAMKEFLPREAVRQPEWVSALMSRYWQ